ncbi:DUF4333 domain-containing protein [Streptomyces sp. NBC_00820]|uniref:DUF4333 domain-containing protein n=1 Tax=Streptomyces sp. NBC_00820 TaxID=2975842 RepID=UPI002ED1879B|nr:DUF4333 domain-containing protein [Streptomyces sp. NBC_00820]
MPRTRPSAALSILSTAAAGAVLVGCSASVSVGKPTPKLSADKLAGTVSKKLAAAKGLPEPDITCPEDLKGKVGTTTRCKLTAKDGSTLGISVKVTSVDGERINFAIEADDHATPPKN